MSPSPRLLRSLVLLIATVLAVPLAALVTAAPAHAAPGIATGGVYDALGDPLDGVQVAALSAPAYTTVASSTATDPDGAYSLGLSAGSYRLRYALAGYTTAFYDGETTLDVVVDGDGDITAGGEPLEDNVLADMTLSSTTRHDVTGTVRNAGSTPLPGITVDIFTSGDDETPVDTATTNGSGAYALDVPSGIYQLRYTDPGEEYLTTWYGGAEPEDVTVSADLALDPVTMTTPPPAAEYPIAGAVADALGEPVANVTVTVTGVGGSDDSGTDTTDANGAYDIEVRPGTYQVSYAKTGWVSTTYGGQGSPSTITVGNAGTLSVAPEEELSGNHLGDVTLASTPFAVNGSVKADGTGTGLAGITVRAFPEGSTDPADVVDTDTSAAGGAYALTLPVGSYDLEYVDNDASAPTYTSASLSQVTVAQGGDLFVGGAPVGVLPDVSMALSSADTPHPVVGSVVDVNGAEIDGLTVSAVPQGETPGAHAASDTTGADGGLGDHGRYRLMLKPGTYQVTVDGGADWADTTYVGEGSGTALITVQLNGTVLVNGVEAVGGELGSTEVVGSRTYSLSGSATEGGTGLVGITVKAYPESDPETAVATTTTTTGGAWTLSGGQGLVVGSYLIELSGTSGGNTYDRTWFGGATPTPVEMAQGGVAKVDGSPIASNTLPAVAMTKSSADTTHPVPGEVVDVNGDPVAGVVVTATPASGPNTASDTTDADGAYTLLLKPGTYTLTYAKTGFTSATYPGPGETPVTVTVGLDGSAPTLDPVALEDATGDTTISGKVVAAAGGAAIGGIHVEVFPEGDVSAESRVAHATTSGTGAWSVSTLKIGSYTVRFTDTDGVAPTYIQTYLGGADLVSASPVKVGQANAVSVDDVPQPGGALGDTAMTASTADTTYDVVGELGDANGDPIDGATVIAVPQGATPVGNQVSDTTGADGALGDHGRYRLALKAGTYRITFAAPGFTGTTYPGGEDAPVDVVVTAGDAERELDYVTLDDATGDATLSGRVVAEGGGALSGIKVDISPEGDPTTIVATTTTSGTGTWSRSTLRIGSYEVRFSGSSGGTTYQERTIGPIKVGQGNAVSVDDVPKPGGALGDTALAPASVDTTYPILGDVYDANLDPLEGVTITAEAKAGGAVTASTTSDEEGAFTLQVKAGTYEVRYALSGFQTRYYPNLEETGRAQVQVLAGGAVKIDGVDQPSKTLDSVELKGTTTYPLGGSVVDAANQAIGGIKVRATLDGESTHLVETTTAGNGSFTLNLPVGTYTIAFVDTVPAAPAYITTYFGGGTGRLVKVSANGASPITDAETGEPIAGTGTITMQAASADTEYDVKGLVFDETYEPLDDATVLVLPVGATSDAQAVASGTTGADVDAEEEHGFYRVPVVAGKYWLKYKATGYASSYLVDWETGKPAVVTVAASGITSPGFEFVGNQIEDVQLLLPAPKLVTAPKLTGKVAVGEKITTTVGKWNPDIEQYADWKDYVTIEWFIDGRPADDYSSGYYYQTYKIPAEAAGRTLSYRITIEDANPDGPFLSPIVWTSKPIAVPKATPKLTAAFKKGKLTVLVKVPGISKPLGTITVKDGKKKYVFKLAANDKGKLVEKLKLKPGKHTLKISYSGDATVAPAKTKVKVKV